ncbi:MAG: polysaccharide export protein [Alphaproteobacteria bacterium]|nr:polysaccharide export protein [Alphaproteobacteria bacterium]
MKVKLVAATIAPLLVAACGSLPSSGPTVSEVRGGAQHDDVSQYLVVDIDGRALDQLSTRRDAGLYDSFGTDSGAPSLHIGVGDVVAVTIWEVGPGGLFSGASPSSAVAAAAGAEQSGSQTSTIPAQVVGSDGAISIPFVGRVRVAGMTPQGAEAAIRSGLQGKAMEPQVLVSVTNNVSGTVSVMGEVTGGARIPLSLRGDRILDVIAAAGGIKTPVHDTTIQLTRNGRTAAVPLKALLDDPRENVYALPGDLITVSRETRKFVMLGAAGDNNEVPFEAASLSLIQAIGKSRGLVDSRSDAEGVFVFRYEPAEIARALDPRSPLSELGGMVPVVYRLDLSDARGYFSAQRFAVMNGDVIYVSNAPLNELQKVFSLFGTLTSPILSGAAVYNATKD